MAINSFVRVESRSGNNKDEVVVLAQRGELAIGGKLGVMIAGKGRWDRF